MALRGEELDLEKLAVYDSHNWMTPLDMARDENHMEMTSMLEKFAANPAQTQYELREELGLPGSRASQIFALVVFLCLHIKQAEAPTPAGRFFAIALLPMELQMVLCHRVAGLNKDNFLSRDSDSPFSAWQIS